MSRPAHLAPLPQQASTDAACTGVSLQGVTLRRGASTVLHEITLELTQPRIGLIGDNGSGKSSLFRLISGLDAPQLGQVLVCGHDVHHAGAHAVRVGLMFQNPDEQIIFPTVQEELALSLTAAGLSRAQAHAKVQTFLHGRGLEAWSERAIATLSQGQRQHVCWLALSLASPRLLLLDEPFASLDLPSQTLLRHEIAAAPHQVIVATHQLEHVRDFTRVLWLDKGRVRADGPGREVCAAYEADVASRMAARDLSFNDAVQPAALAV
ncbi:MAG TPA: ABC transporter ATP-binding protein [Ramlibacter sp.]|nr:ABC transporter ATP-binding protein [Ramlibacter sp.]